MFKPTLQTKFNREGNCLAACIASLFPVDINDVPELSYNSSWEKELSDWFKWKLNKYAFIVSIPQEGIELLNNSLMLTIINSTNPDPEIKRHCVITKNNRIIFDPLIGEVDYPVKENMNPTYLIVGNVLN